MAINEWDDFADQWDSNPSAKKYANNAFEELNKVVKLNKAMVLDFGCGTGLLSEKLSSYADQVVALDGSLKMIEQLKQKSISNVTPIADFLSPELIDNEPQLGREFDLITASSVCAFLPDYKATLKLLRSLLKPRGFFIQWDWLYINSWWFRCRCLLSVYK